MKKIKWIIIGLGLILVIVVALYFRALGQGIPNPTKAKADMMMLRTALQVYRMEYGAFPSGDTAAVMSALSGKNPKKIIILSLSPKDLNDRGEFIDPWGTPYQITISHEKGLVIRSAGENKQFDDGPGSDDIILPGPNF